MLQGEGDDVVNNAVARASFEKMVQAADKQLIVYEGMDHFMCGLDDDYQVVRADQLKWIFNHINKDKEVLAKL